MMGKPGDNLIEHKFKFSDYSMSEKNEKWESSIKRESALQMHSYDIRSEFYRDYTRILHSCAYRRLKHKTQVFFSPKNDHICTRIEHVNHVESVSYTIAKFLGLNVELTTAIAIGHDLGHAPFGHEGEKLISKLSESEIGTKFEHEKNSLHFVDKIETLPDHEGNERNLGLTYAVRDGILFHCGEEDQTSPLKPRMENDNLYDLLSGKRQPYTWEGCIVKIADKISYLGRDIEDALSLKIIDKKMIDDNLSHVYKVNENGTINNSRLIHEFIIDLCVNSSPEGGIMLSQEYNEKMNAIKIFNYANIYSCDKKRHYESYIRIVIETIYEYLCNFDDYTQNGNSFISTYKEWIKKYSNKFVNSRDPKYHNSIIYENNDIDKKKAIIDFIAGMTDQFAIDAYNYIIKF